MPALTSDELKIMNDNWKFRITIRRGNYQFLKYSNTEIPLLWKVTMAQISPPMFAGYIICSNSQATILTYENTWTDWYNQYVDGYFITDNAYKVIDMWRESLIEEPEPEPEPEQPPDPIDDGNGIIDGWIDTTKDWIKQAILAGLAFLEEPLKIIKDMVAKLGQIISGIVSAVKSAIASVMAEMASIFETVIGKIQGVIDAVWSHIQSIWETLKDMFKTIKTAIVIAFEKSWIFIKETFTTLWEKIKSGLTYIGNAIVEGLKYLWDKIKDALNWIWDILNNAYKAIVNAVKAVWDRFKERLTETIESIKAAFGDAVDRLTDFFQLQIDTWREETRTAQEWTDDKLTEFIEWVLKAQNRVLERITEAGGKI